MAEPKTKPNELPVADYLNSIPDAQVCQDCWTIVEIMQEAAQAGPRMWGTAIVGFGQYRAVNASGKGCLYFKRLTDVDLPPLKELVSASVDYVVRTYPASQ